MTDTARSLSALQALLADNTAGDISPQDLRDVLVSALGGYGGLHVTAGATLQACTATPVLLTQWTGVFASDQMTPAHATDGVTATVAMTARASVSLAFTSSAAVAVTFEIRKNAVLVTGAKSTSTVVTTGETMGAHIEAVVSLAASDVLTVYVSSASASNVTVQEGQFVVTRVA